MPNHLDVQFERIDQTVTPLHTDTETGRFWGERTCRYRITATYTGPDPAGVTSWQAGLADNAFSAVNKFRIRPPSLAVPGPNSPFVVVSETNTELVLEVDPAVEPGSVGGIILPRADGFLVIRAIGPAEGPSETSLGVSCEPMSVVQHDGITSFAGHRPARIGPGGEATGEVIATDDDGNRSFLRTRESHPACPRHTYRVLRRDNAGPVVGGSRTGEGVMLTIEVIECATASTLGSETSLERGDPCCDVPPDWPGDPPTDPVNVELPDLQLLPPRPPSPAWREGRLAPRARYRYPQRDVAPADDTAYGDRNAARYQVVEVFLGRCAVPLLTTPASEWGTLDPTGEEVQELQTHALFRSYDPRQRPGGFGQGGIPWDYSEIDLAVDTPTGTETEQQPAARESNVHLTVTRNHCDDCCGCDNGDGILELAYTFDGFDVRSCEYDFGEEVITTFPITQCTGGIETVETQYPRFVRAPQLDRLVARDPRFGSANVPELFGQAARDQAESSCGQVIGTFPQPQINQLYVRELPTGTHYFQSHFDGTQEVVTVDETVEYNTCSFLDFRDGATFVNTRGGTGFNSGGDPVKNGDPFESPPLWQSPRFRVLDDGGEVSGTTRASTSVGVSLHEDVLDDVVSICGCNGPVKPAVAGLAKEGLPSFTTIVMKSSGLGIPGHINSTSYGNTRESTLGLTVAAEFGDVDGTVDGSLRTTFSVCVPTDWLRVPNMYYSEGRSRSRRINCGGDVSGEAFLTQQEGEQAFLEPVYFRTFTACPKCWRQAASGAYAHRGVGCGGFV